MSTEMVLFFLLLLLFIIHFSPAACQMLPAYAHIEGEWHLLHRSIGISAMHMQLLKNNKVVIFDRTDFGPSNISLSGRRCRFDPNDRVLKKDCTAHSILYDIRTNGFRTLTVQTDTWCSSGALLPDGTLVQTGGYNDGDHVIRILVPCNGGNCDWVEFPRSLSRRRWYASNQILPDGRVIIVGGRAQFNYEFYPGHSPSSSKSFRLNFLRETKDGHENNLYPFLHLLPDGNLFVFANTRSIVFNYKRNQIVREFPAIPGADPRNYPSSGSSVLLPIDENAPVVPEIMICGGATRNAFELANRGVFQRACSTCGRLKITKEEPAWKIENMPMPRVMSDMLILPDGYVIIINGARSGTAGWEYAKNPVTRPLIYNPNGKAGVRFSIMAASSRPRLYHSTAVLLTDGRILVGGSNPHKYYNFTGVDYPTDLSLESFSPPYLSPVYDRLRPRIIRTYEIIRYKNAFSLTFTVQRFVKTSAVSVRIVAPSFNTHSFSMNQRMVVLKGARVSRVGPNVYRVAASGPSKPEIAPPGYYLLFLLHAGIPSSGMWVKIQ
ncbi:aldehyde oxidase GLOX [Sesamum indicum]|uniref:Aldehyde oxidase GLOX n=1 Tax=Sesamum indicum TaxID=4182 RepID=A0A6I9SRS4_SESIN|nr:aldehyde oxidase GLOX [Sesamum indicum]